MFCLCIHLYVLDLHMCYAQPWVSCVVLFSKVMLKAQVSDEKKRLLAHVVVMVGIWVHCSWFIMVKISSDRSACFIISLLWLSVESA